VGNVPLFHSELAVKLQLFSDEIGVHFRLILPGHYLMLTSIGYTHSEKRGTILMRSLVIFVIIIK